MKIVVVSGKQSSTSGAALKVPSRAGLPADAKAAIKDALTQMRNTASVSPLLFVLNQIRRSDLTKAQQKTIERLYDFCNKMRQRLGRYGSPRRDLLGLHGGRGVYPVSIPRGGGYGWFGHGPRRGRGPRGPYKGKPHGPFPGGPGRGPGGLPGPVKGGPPRMVRDKQPTLRVTV
jgi:hypothetical protein